ncbi:hypothetical protein PVAND_014859 [Polypedilum vanderplanki]|uniref:Uncharacterized protein n=1 Tax=Polypedilum vanderplanki TaxID=319348 RepID=A0A9J6BAF2_POLVA|nr:hypothetical protein PVAND_014859 [Polypedilum vanderplanki]
MVKFKTDGFRLKAFDGNDINEIIRYILKAKNKEKINEMYEYINSLRDVDNPLLIKMITEYHKETTDSLIATNIFVLYEAIIKQKIQIFNEKGNIVASDRDNDSVLNIWKVHQVYAIKLLAKSVRDSKKFFIMKKWLKDKKNWNSGKISRYGFLFVDFWNTSDERPDFTHRTFAEFFFAKFLIENRLNNSAILHFILFDQITEIVLKFLEKYFEFSGNPNKSLKVNLKIIKSLQDQNVKLKIQDHFEKYVEESTYPTNIKVLALLYNSNENILKEIFYKNEETTIFSYFFSEKNSWELYKVFHFIVDCTGNNWQQFIGYKLKSNQKDSFLSEIKKQNRKLTEHWKFNLAFIKSFDIPRDLISKYVQENVQNILEVAFVFDPDALEFFIILKSLDYTKQFISDIFMKANKKNYFLRPEKILPNYVIVINQYFNKLKVILNYNDDLMINFLSRCLTLNNA